MIQIKVIAGSTRPGRFNVQPAHWAYAIAKQRKDIEVTLLDLAEINLPLLNEEATPSEHKYEKEHTKKWAKMIGEADGFLVIAPEYNHSIPAALKNAFDYLFMEWNFKPVSYISYGSLAGGARSVEHLRAVAGELKMYDLREQILLPNYWDNLDEKGNYKFNERHEKSLNEMLDNLTFWAGKMKEARAELEKVEK